MLDQIKAHLLDGISDIRFHRKPVLLHPKKILVGKVS